MSEKNWNNSLIKEITFIVTKDCQLACKYCYLIGKNSDEKMTWPIAQAAVDYILSQEYDEVFATEGVVFDFIGGEPFLEIELIDKICDYIKSMLVSSGHHWKDKFMFSLTTNGINYDNSKVQEFIKKNKENLHITITIDGTQQKHDLNRIWKAPKEGKDYERGSYRDVVRNIPLWLSQFPEAATKVTISSADIPYVCESVIHLFGLGIKDVHINCVFEDVWKEGDDVLFENQLRLLADKMIGEKFFPDYSCTLFDRSIGLPMDNAQDRNWCGAGMMLSIDSAGNFYPCTRFAKYSLRSKSARIIGNIERGIDKNKLRPFYALSRSVQSPAKCLECDVASGCAWCQGENYDAADTPTIFQRSTAICKMHKARVRANNYFWGLIEGKEMSEKPTQLNVTKIDKSLPKIRSVNVLLASDSVSFCKYIPRDYGERVVISKDNLRRVIEMAGEAGWSLNFAYPKGGVPEDLNSLIADIPHIDIKQYARGCSADVMIFDDLNEPPGSKIDYAVIRMTLQFFFQRTNQMKDFLALADRVDVIFLNENEFGEKHYKSYKDALDKLSDTVLDLWAGGHRVKVNIITERLFLTSPHECGAGSDSVTLSPDGKFYVCPAFYYDDPSNSSGSLDSGIRLCNQQLYKRNHSSICVDCNAYQCQRCVYLNSVKTLEVNIPSFEQCRKATLELEATKMFYSKCDRLNKNYEC